MLSIQETVNKTEAQRRAIKESMEANGCYHPDDASLYTGLNQADRYEVEQTIKNVSLAEFLAKSSTTGIQGAAYLVAPKLHDELMFWSKKTDIVPLISAKVASHWDGEALDVNVVDDHSYRPVEFSSGGKIASVSIYDKKPRCTCKSFGLSVPIGNDMIEDSAYSIIEYHVDKAAMTMGDYASELALNVLKAGVVASWGSVNGGVSGDAAETKWTGGTTWSITNTTAAKSIVQQLTQDKWIPNTLIITTEAWEHSVKLTYDTLADNIPIHYNMPPPAPGFDIKLGIPPLDTLFCNNRALHNWASNTDTGAMTECVTIVFDRNNALFTGRKRWLEVANYADPVADLSTAVITARQGNVTLYNDAIGVITETA